MTEQQHPITPPQELVKQWYHEIDDHSSAWEQFATKAAQWGADQELDACCEWLAEEEEPTYINALRDARRPKPPSLKEEALEALRSMRIDPVIPGKEVSDKYDIIRRALESLSE